MPCRSMVTRSPSMAGRSTTSSSASFSRSRSSWRWTSSSVTLETGQRHLQAVVSGDGDQGAHLHDGVEGDRAAVLAPGDVDLGLRDRVELGVDHGAGVEVGQRLAQRLGPQRAGAAHARLEHLARHLARPEPGTRTCGRACARRRRARDRTRARRSPRSGGRGSPPVARWWRASRADTLPAASGPGARGATRNRPTEASEHEVHGGEHLAAGHRVPRSADRPAACTCCRRGPAAAEAHEVDARERQRHGRGHLVAHRPGPPALDRHVKPRASRPGPATSKRTAVPSAQPACLPTTNRMAPCTRSREIAEAGSRPRRAGRGRAARPARAPSCRRRAPP